MCHAVMPCAGIHPGHAIIGKYEVGALLEIQGCKNDGRERNESE